MATLLVIDDDPLIREIVGALRTIVVGFAMGITLGLHQLLLMLALSPISKRLYLAKVSNKREII